MKIFVLEGKSFVDKNGRERTYFSHDQQHGVVVRARNEEHARELAAQEAGNKEHEQEPWLNPELTSCEVVTNKGKPGIILRDYLAG